MSLHLKDLRFILVGCITFFAHSAAALGAFIDFTFIGFKMFLATWAGQFNLTHIFSAHISSALVGDYAYD